MTIVPVLFALACLGVAVWAATDIVTLLFRRRTTIGRVIANSYSEEERLAARAAHPFDFLYKVTTLNLKPAVKDVLTVEYEAGGRTYRRSVETAHLRGDNADPAPTVWYDPDNPESMTLDGPRQPAIVVLGALGLAAWSVGLI